MSASPALSVVLREGSRDEHRHAEDAPFVHDLIAGRAGADRYVAYLLRLRAVYRSLEDQVRRRLAGHPVLGGVFDPALERSAALDGDLADWGSAADLEVASPAVTAYRDRLARAGEDPHRLVAHHYTRYLGDLSGGQILARAVREHLRPPEGRGLAFYDFSAVGRPVPYREAYRRRLDDLALDAAQRAEVLAEVRTAFALNRALFDEL